MAYWIEIRCDTQDHEQCWSKQNAGPMALSGNTREATAHTMIGLRGEAKSKGWKLGREFWSCPACSTRRASG